MSNATIVPGSVATPGCGGPGPHSATLLTLVFGCVHEHIGQEEVCSNCLSRIRTSAGGRARCFQCGHQCLCAYFLPEIDEEFRFNERF